MSEPSASIAQDIKTIRDIERALEEAEHFVERVKGNKIKLTLTDGTIAMSQDEMQKITDLIVTMERSGKSLEKAVGYLRELMAYDEVTQMFTRRYLFHLLEKELYRAKRYESQFALIAVELQLPPAIAIQDLNLTVGEASRVVRQYVRDSDSCGRTGERAFMLVLPETPVSGAQTLADRIVAGVNKTVDAAGGPVTMSAVAAVLDSNDMAATDMASLLFSIDQALANARDAAGVKAA